MTTMTRFLVALLGFTSIAASALAQDGRGFQVGDRILLTVEGDSILSDTLTVHPGPAVMLPVIGAIPLQGVKRIDIEPYMRDRLAHYLKDPVVHAKALVRLAIEGEVAHPGFYAVPTDVVLSDALMSAGGLTTEAKMSDMKIDRAGHELLEGERLQFAVAQGKTIDDLGLHAGDRIYVPRLVRHDPESKFRILAILLTVPVGIYTIMHLR